jgi:transcriptional regulator with XRE-family HTH domain
MSIGHRIRTERKARDMSQEAMAKKLGISREAISQWETGDILYLKPENLVRTARLFGVTVEWLVFGTPPKHPPSCDRHAKGKSNEPRNIPVSNPNPINLDPEAMKLILLYQRIPTSHRALVHQFFQFLARGVPPSSSVPAPP